MITISCLKDRTQISAIFLYIVACPFGKICICRLISASHRANKKSVKVREVESRGYQDVQGVTVGDTHAKT